MCDQARRRAPLCTVTHAWSILRRRDTTAGRAVAIVAREAAARVQRLGAMAWHRRCPSETSSPALCRRRRWSAARTVIVGGIYARAVALACTPQGRSPHPHITLVGTRREHGYV